MKKLLGKAWSAIKKAAPVVLSELLQKWADRRKQ